MVAYSPPKLQVVIVTVAAPGAGAVAVPKAEVKLHWLQAGVVPNIATIVSSAVMHVRSFVNLVNVPMIVWFVEKMIAEIRLYIDVTTVFTPETFLFYNITNRNLFVKLLYSINNYK